MPYPASTSERQRQLSTSLSINTPSQSKMMRSGFIIASFPISIRAYTQRLGNNPDRALKLRISEVLDTPAQSRRVNGLIPELLHLIIKHRHRDRATGHVERCDEVTDQRSRNDGAGGLEQSADSIVHQIEFRERRCAKAVDEQNCLAAHSLAQIGRNCADHLGRDLGSRPKLYAATPRLAMNAYTDLHLVLGNVEGWLAGRRDRATRQGDPDRTRGRVDAIAQELQCSKVASLFRCRSDDFLYNERASDAAPSGRKGRGLYRDIVIGNHRCNRFSRHLARHVEVHGVALIVLDDEQYACTGVRGLGGGENEIGRGRGKDLTGARGIQHPVPDKTGVQRFVSRASTRHQRHLAGLEMPALYKRRVLAEAHDVGMRRAESGQAFTHHIFGGVDQLLHSTLPCASLRRQVSSISRATFSANSLSSESSLWFFCSDPRSGSISVRRRLRSRSFRRSSRRGCAR